MFVSTMKTDPLLDRISICKSMDQLKQIHLQAIVRGLSLNPLICFKLIVFCCARDPGSVNYARQMFDIMPEPKVFIWNMIIKGYSRTNRTEYAVSMYVQMLRRDMKPDNYTFPFLLNGFTKRVGLEFGKGIHCHACKFGFGSNPAVETSLMQMYSLRGDMSDARMVFDTCLKTKSNAIIWNIMIAGYNRSKRFNESRKLFHEMEKRRIEPTCVTLVSMLSVCSKLKDTTGCKYVHGYIYDGRIEPNLVLNNALVDAYAACGEMDAALSVFKNMKARDVISWTAMLSGFLNIGKLDLARELFDEMPVRDSVSWTAMIDGYVKQNRFKEALMLFKNMQDAKVEPDEFTMVSVLTACANTGALELGKWVNVCINKNKIKNDVFVGNALIDMYFKCGEVGKAVDIFNKMPKRDKFTWTAIIVGYAINGFGNEAINMFNEMLNASVKPDQICYLGVLSACTHTGMVDEGRKFFADMSIHHGIEPEVEHYGCMVDLLGRAGLLAQAYDLINTMPVKPNSVVWRALLGACGIHKDVDLAEIAAKKLIELEPENGGVYVLLCNIYAACNRWDDLHKLRNIMMIRGVTKTPGCSSIEIYGTVNEFVARDRSHCRSEVIYSTVDMITEELRVFGYAPEVSETFLE
ncbi:putative tetratricopeptide-like helical domain superfamily [Helianthus annuus]|nr:putative tetratricopeptide-like helical domain superfamily [Helianthus annuus]KAJ0884445.1 putative tetratricopeptide-like helical domain superfamily [Helianthus annuus]